MGKVESQGSRPVGDWNDLTGHDVGRFSVGNRLGSGGAAVVYQAYDRVAGRTVALKVLPSDSSARARDRFRREALMAGALRHPNIVRIYQVGASDQGGMAYIAMELVEGETLRDVLARRGRLLAAESCNLLEPIARALAHAHKHGVVHRDVKPGNILLKPASVGVQNYVQLESIDHPVAPVLTDFGVARYLDAPDLTNAGRTVGTPAFMAPEQCAGSRTVDGRADIYALGAVLYRCVVGRSPYSGSATQIMHAQVYEPLLICQVVLDAMDDVVLGILRESLVKEPDGRLADAERMADMLATAGGRAIDLACTDAGESLTTALSGPSLAPASDDETQSSGPAAVLIQVGSGLDSLPGPTDKEPHSVASYWRFVRRRTVLLALVGMLILAALLALVCMRAGA